MFRSYRIGSILGIPIKLDVTFLLILPVFAWVIAVQFVELAEILNLAIGAGIDPDVFAGTEWIWVLGLAAAIGLFVSVLLHELGHSVAAMRYDVPIESITLWLLGGVASFTEMPKNWRHEFVIAIAGPLVSVGIGVGSYLLLFAVPPAFDGVRFVVAYLAVMNVFLAAFNMLPAFPLDGGRVLRSLLARNRPYAAATQQAARVGQLFAIALGLFGLLALNFVLIAIAFFVYIAAAGEARQTALEAAVGDLLVADVMIPSNELVTARPEETVSDLLERMFRERHSGFPVVDDGHVVGIVTLEDVQDVAPVERDAMLVRDVMRTDPETLDVDDEVVPAMITLQRSGADRVLVTDESGGAVGMVTRSDLARALSIGMVRGPREPDERDRPLEEVSMTDSTPHRW